MNNGQQIPPPLPSPGQPMPKKKQGGLLRYLFLGLLALIFLVFVFGSINKSDSSKEKISQAVSDSIYLDKVDSILHAVPPADFPENLDRLVLISIQNTIDTTNRKLSADNGTRAIELLEKKGPEWRKIYAEKLDKALWEHNIDVEVSGKTITFIGGTFAKNANIKQFHKNAAGTLSILGFKQVRYKWIKHTDEYQYFNL